MLLFHFWFKFILFGNLGYINFCFNWCSVFMKSCFSYLENLGGGVFEVGGGGDTPMHTTKLDALLHKIGIRIPRLNMCTPMTSLSKIAYQMWCHHPSIQRNKTLEWVGGWSKQGREGVDKIWKKGEGRQYRGVFIK